MPDHLASLHEVRNLFPEAVLIGTAYRHWTGDPVRALPPGGSARLIRYFHEASRRRAPVYTSSAAFSREPSRTVGLLEHLTVGVMDVWVRLALHGPVAASTKQTILYRVGTGGITDSNAPEAPQTTILDQMFLPVVTLMGRLDGITHKQLRRDVMDYIDFDIGLPVLKAVRSGQIDYPRKLLDIFLVGPSGKARIAALLARLPHPCGERLRPLAFGLKRAVRLSTV
jgi:hypothetical protein